MPAQDTHVMVVPIRHAEVEHGKTHPLPPGLQVLHVYAMLTAGSKQVLIVVQNMMDSASFLKKVCMWHMLYQQCWCLQRKCPQDKLKVCKCLENDSLCKSGRRN